ncbi:hypothetical protein E4U41_004624 [Claviceps citrina]|nr:hypothetical protein E4U41_004624 [Claviceps citrina]
MASLLTSRGVAAMAALEAFLVVRLCPDRLYLTSEGGTIAQLLEASLLLFVANCFIVFTYSRFLYPRVLGPLRKVPRPKSYFSRMLYARFVKQEHHGALLLDVAESTPNHGLLVLNEGLQDRVFAVSLPVIAEMLVHKPYDFVKPQNVRDFMCHFLGDGLIVAEGARHSWLRKHSQRHFGYRQIRDLYPMMWKKALGWQSALEDEINAASASASASASVEEAPPVAFEMCGWAAKTTFDVIGMAGLGRDFNLVGDADAQDEFVSDYESVTGDHMLLYFVMSMWLSFRLVRLLPWRKNDFFMEKTASLKRTCQKIIRGKRDELVGKGRDQSDILALLIKSGDFSDDELGDQLLTYMVAGHDTASATLVWACFLLVQHPKWQILLRQELRQARLPREELPQPADEIAATLERLPILNGVLSETLRLYPPVPVTTRVAARDTCLGGYMIPKGTEILMSPWAVNRSPQHWGADAGQFDPNRWIQNGRPSNSGAAESSNYALMTFLHGPRSCIGQGFARAELRCLLAALLSRFELTLATDAASVVPAGAITIRPHNGLRVNMKVVAN